MLAAAAIDAPADGDVFRAFVDHALVPRLRPGTVVMMDNLAAHKVAACRLEFLPA